MKPAVAMLVASMLFAACRGGEPPDDQTTGSVDSSTWMRARALPPGVAAALDSGNAAFRSRDFDAARRHYRRAVELGPQESAAWFGLSMAERQLGNPVAADSAMQRVQQLTPEASLIEPAAGGSR